MEFKLQFNMDNEVFDEFPSTEVIRIFDDIKVSIWIGIFRDVVMDVNGNKIGQWSISD